MLPFSVIQIDNKLINFRCGNAICDLSFVLGRGQNTTEERNCERKCGKATISNGKEYLDHSECS